MATGCGLGPTCGCHRLSFILCVLKLYIFYPVCRCQRTLPATGAGTMFGLDVGLFQYIGNLGFLPGSNSLIFLAANWAFACEAESMVGLTGLEPVTLRLSSACSNQLSYRPMCEPAERGGKGIRTPDIQLAKLALYQLSYAPVKTVRLDREEGLAAFQAPVGEPMLAGRKAKTEVCAPEVSTSARLSPLKF